VSGLQIRAATATDAEAIWAVIEPVVRAGDTYSLPQDMSREAALAYWCGPAHSVFVAERALPDGRDVVGTYYLRANQAGGGDHVANCGYMVSAQAAGQGVARAMAGHSMQIARDRGFLAMQFNFVVSTNERAVRLWKSLGFTVVGRLPGAFRHPREGFVDALVMFRDL
jgi:ribosomal protein S18 acetylase RimI-like enzyme